MGSRMVAQLKPGKGKIMKTQLHPGQQVDVYQDPITKKKFEGKAKLVSEYRPDEGSGLPMWHVEFNDEPGQTYLRTIFTL